MGVLGVVVGWEMWGGRGVCVPGTFAPSVPHLHPPTRYQSIPPTPNTTNTTKTGSECLALLQRAWQQRLTFTVGTSITTGQPNTVRPHTYVGRAWVWVPLSRPPPPQTYIYAYMHTNKTGCLERDPPQNEPKRRPVRLS